MKISATLWAHEAREALYNFYIYSPIFSVEFSYSIFKVQGPNLQKILNFVVRLFSFNVMT